MENDYEVTDVARFPTTEMVNSRYVVGKVVVVGASLIITKLCFRHGIYANI